MRRISHRKVRFVIIPDPIPHDNQQKIGNPKDSEFKDLTLFVSFPRTGSHWFRQILELYLERPSYTASFYYKNKPWGFHTHATNINGHRFRYHNSLPEDNWKGFLYLDRIDKCKTIYSLIKFMGWGFDQQRIVGISNDIDNHRKKWIKFISSYGGAYITYEDIKTKNFERLDGVVKLINGESLNMERMSFIIDYLSKKKVLDAIAGDKRVVKLGDSYQEEYKEKSKIIKETLNDN